MNFYGAAKPLSPEDFSACLALMPGVEEAALRSVISVETGGSGFKSGRPDALFERHLFYAELGPGPKRDDAVSKNLAYPHWIPGNYPKSSAGVYDQINAACRIDENAALRATSWGLGQILGRECLEAGYPTAAAMVADFCDSEKVQLIGMIRLIKGRSLDAALRDHRWADFALHYNGTGYRANQYDTKLAAAYAKWKAGPTPGTDEVQTQGIQKMLAALNLYTGSADGIYGPITQEAVKAFQRQHDLIVDGVAGPATKKALTDAAAELATPVKKPVIPPPPDIPAPKPGAGGSVAPGLPGSPRATEPAKPVHPAVKGAAGAVIGAGAASMASASDPSNTFPLFIGLIVLGVLAGLAYHFIFSKPKKGN